ncbi:maintenance of mitochondrial structure and function-domain-containing protein [Pisolithus albus]|nr:maintenance of mitochondrial structure and function-domain-containing protein [Pisolithus albus]
MPGPSHLETVGIPTDAYYTVEDKDDGTETRKTFLHVPSAIEAEEAEEIGVKHLLWDIKDSTTTMLVTHGLQSWLGDIHTYLLDVAEGKLPVNHQIIYHLQDALNLLPDLGDAELTQSFTSSTNDELLVVYLSSLLRAVNAINARAKYPAHQTVKDASPQAQGQTTASRATGTYI